MQIEQIILYATIGLNAIAGFVALLKGNTDEATKRQQKAQKSLNKLLKKHEKTTTKFVKEEQKIKELKGDNQNASSM